jgi:hypothetical protein
MKTQDLSSQDPAKDAARGSHAPTRPSCPRCGRSMSVRQAAPLMFASDIDEVVYGCAGCGTQAKRTIKRG